MMIIFTIMTAGLTRSGDSGPAGSGVPLLASRPLVSGAPAAYVCHRYTGQAPVTTREALRDTLRTD